MFLNFVKGTTALSRVTAQGALPRWGTVTLLLAQKDGQLGAQLSMLRVLYIPQSLANLISLAKLNDWIILGQLYLSLVQCKRNWKPSWIYS